MKVVPKDFKNIFKRLLSKNTSTYLLDLICDYLEYVYHFLNLYSPKTWIISIIK